MGHIQGLTPIQFYNSVANVIITDTVVKVISKAIDMQFYCLLDWRWQNFHVNLKQGKHNIADNPSKHHYTKHQISVQPTYVHNNI